MANSIELTVVYEPGEDDWILARVAELPGVLTQGRTQADARDMALSALRDWLQFGIEEQRGDEPVEVPEGVRSEPVALALA